MRLDTVEKRLAARYVPKDYTTELRFDSINAVVFASRTDRGIFALAYHGTSSNPDWHHLFKTADRFEAHVQSWVSGLEQWQAMRAEQAAKRKAPHNLKVGNILVSTWGYDQTNVDYYEVIAVRGKVVDIQEIGEHFTDRNGPAGDHVIPVRNYRGKIYRGKRPSASGYVRIDDVCSAHLWDGRPHYQTDTMFGH